MTLLYIVAVISLVVIIGVLVWFALEDPSIRGTSNGCYHKFPHNRP